MTTSHDINGTDVPGNASTTVALGVGLQGGIDSADDTDWYQVSLTAGQTYYFTLNSVSGSGLDPYLAVYGQFYWSNTPTLVTSNNDSGPETNAFVTYTPTTSGTYFVAASGYAWSQGLYSLSYGTMPADTIAGDQTTSATLAVGQTITGIASGTDSDWYAVQLTAGVTYEVNLTSTPSGNIAGIDAGAVNVFSYDGQVHYLATGTFTPYPTPYSLYTDSAHTFFTPTTSGTYYVNAQSLDASPGQQANHVNGGGYSLQVAVAAPDIDASGAVNLAIGSSISSVISQPTDTDTFNVSLVGGQTYLFYMTASGDQPTQSTSLKIGGQSTTGDTYNGTASAIRFTASGTGTYSLVAGGFGGGYTITAETTTADIPGNASTNATVPIGSTINGYTDSEGDVDWYAVTLTAGTTYAFSMSSRFNHYAVKTFNLVTADGTVLTAGSNNDYSGSAFSMQYTPSVSGTYYLSALSTWPANDYTIKAIAPVDPQGSTLATAQAVALGQVVTGQVDFAGDKDMFSIDVVSGAGYAIDLYGTGTDPLRWAQFTVVDAADNSVSGAGASSDYDAHTVYTATYTGKLYFFVNSNIQSLDHGTYTVRAALLDGLSNSVDTSAILPIGQSLSSTIDFTPNSSGYNADVDLIAVSLQAGQAYDFTAVGSGAVPTDPTLMLLNAYGDAIYTAGGTYNHQQFVADQSGVYYLRVAANNPYQTGGYTVTATATTDVFDQSNTRTVLTAGTPIHSSIDTATDHDYFKVTLAAGQDYIIAVTADGASALAAPRVGLYGSDNNQVSVASTTGPTAGSAEFRYTATTAGTYYVDVSGVSGAKGGYTVALTPVPQQNPAATLDSGHAVANGAVSVYFATSGQSFDGHTPAQSWTDGQIAAFLAAAGEWSKVANVSFTQATSAATASLVVLLDASATGVTSIAAAQGTPEVAVFGQTGVNTSVAAGSAAYETFLTATGHALGLVSPYGWSPTHEPLEGVNVPGDIGAGGLNQDFYTVMASAPQYSAPWWFQSYSGLAAGPMALDVAAIQAKYGTVVHNATNTTYTLPTSASPTGFTVIWDTGGSDTITAGDPTKPVVIDLHAATLTNTTGGGGYLSYAIDAPGGFVIANGVVIENATGGSSADYLAGNDGNNVLTGNDGDDSLIGGLGDDTLIGGNGSDTVSFAGASTGIRVDLTLTTAQDTHQGIKTLSGIENVTGSDHDDVIKLAPGTARVDGGAGNDTVILSGTYASYTIALNYFYGPTILTNASGDSDSLSGIEFLQFSDRTVDIRLPTNVAPYITGDFSAGVAENGNYTLTTDDLNFVDPDNSVITYTISNLRNGTVLVGGVTATTFTSTQVEAGQVVFHQSGSDTNAVFSISASDGQATYNGNNSMLFQIIHAPGQVIFDTDVGNVISGTDGDDYITGNGGDDTIQGGLGNDTIDGGKGSNTASYANATGAVQANVGYYGSGGSGSGAAGVDTLKNIQNLTGSNYNDQLNGDDGNNILNGGGGADTMSGGGGNDTYYVNNVNDQIVEYASGGIDSVFASVSYILSPYVENLTLTGSGNINATGNSQHNTLIGNSGDNILDGGAAPDIMIGGAGNDTYIVDTILDVVTEYANQGTDLVMSSVTYTLGANLENLTLTGTADINATGNSGANVVTGNSGNNVLDGAGGADTLLGGGGNDTFLIRSDSVFADGGTGTNTAVLAGNASQAVVTFDGNGYLIVDAGAQHVTLANIQSVQFGDTTVSTAFAAAITNGYASFFHRAPTAAELGVWSSALSSGTTLAAFNKVLANDASGKANEGALIRYLYDGYLGRDPSGSEITYWTGALQSGATSLAAFNTVLANDGSGKANSYVSVKSMYDTFLGRDPTAAEVGFWTGALRSGSFDLRSFELVLAAQPGAASAETAFITQTYQTWLGHAPTSADITYWSAQLNTGIATPHQIRQAVIADASGQSYISSVISLDYQADFGRAASTAEINIWKGLIAGGASFTTLTSALLADSAGATARTITNAYDTYFGRDPSLSEMGVWRDLFSKGATQATLRSALLGDSSGQAHTVAEIGTLYQTYLGRTPSTSDVNVWKGLVASGTTFTQMHDALIADAGGKAYAASEISVLYQAFEGRAPSSAETSYWTGAFNAGSSNLDAFIDVLLKDAGSHIATTSVAAGHAATTFVDVLDPLVISGFAAGDQINFHGSVFDNFNPLDHAVQVGADVLIYGPDALHVVLIENEQLASLTAANFVHV